MTKLHILQLPAEIITNILARLLVEDLVRFGRTCQTASFCVEPSNQVLWRCTFLHSFDDPRDAWNALTPSAHEANATTENEWDWHHQLRQRLIGCRNLEATFYPSLENDQTCDDIVTTLLSIIATTKPRPTPSEMAKGYRPRVDDRSSLSFDLLAELSNRLEEQLEWTIHHHQLFSLRRPPATDVSGRPVTRSTRKSVEQPEEVSKLHIFYGLTRMEKEDLRLKGMARRLVYNWSLTSADTDYGPFQKGGSGKVHWQLLEAVCSVISRNFEKCAEGQLTMPQGFHYSIPYRTLPNPTVPEDWAGVQGVWLGTYAFLDYADLFQYNVGFGRGNRPNLEDEPEACGDLMRLELKLDMGLRDDLKLNTDLPICRDLPMLFFQGESKGHDGAFRPTIGVRGMACLADGGLEVRWRYLISYGGADQWQLEGVQPGGIRSGGVYGLWSHCDHTENGPVGPFCYFPLELCKSTSVILSPAP